MYVQFEQIFFPTLDIGQNQKHSLNDRISEILKGVMREVGLGIQFGIFKK